MQSQHYFAVADLNSPTHELTFYRVKISAKSFLTNSQYTAGFYDANALHQLFGEVKSPDAPAPAPADADTKAPASTSPATPAPAAAPPAPKPKGPTTTSTSSSPLAGALQLECDTKGNCKVAGGANDRFTVIYGANADAVAQQIQSFADSDATGKQIAALLAASTSADVFERTAAADQNAEQAKKNAAALAKELRSLADQLGNASVLGAANGDDARRILLQAAQQAAKRAGASTIFDTTKVDTGLAQSKAAYDVLAK